MVTMVIAYPESVGYTVLPPTTFETNITGETTGITITGTETHVSVPGYNTHTTIAESKYTFSCSSAEGSSCNVLTETTFYWPSESPIVISYTGTTQYFELSEATTAVLEVPDIITDISMDDIFTHVNIWEYHYFNHCINLIALRSYCPSCYHLCTLHYCCYCT